jgi:tRNA-specific 2-thiouridylase
MPPSKGKVLVAMSGGVDSSVAAALLVRAGYEAVGVFMRLGSPGEDLDTMLPAEACALPSHPTSDIPHPTSLKIGHQGCCSINDAADARLVAAELGIPFYVVNFKKDFGRIIDYFVDEYAIGRTPNPCVRCNDWLKFGKLHQYAQQIGADYVASGHYARVMSDVGCGMSDLPSHPTSDIRHRTSPRLLRGLDHTKDQSYVLFGVPREQLSRMLLPIGGMLKPDVRNLAQQFGLPTFDKPDSQEICFVPDNDYAGLVERKRPDLARPGAIIDESGKRIGEHAGQHRFTIGQRRGVGVALGHPIFVVGKDAASNTVTIGPREQLMVSSCTVNEANWLCEPSDFNDWRPILAKYRYNTPPVSANARIGPDSTDPTPSGRHGTFEVQFDRPQQAVAPGQAMVLYGGDMVLGGGWINQSRAAQAAGV